MTENEKKQYKRVLMNKILSFLHSIKMNEKTLKFNNVQVIKKEIHTSKQPIVLSSVFIIKIVVSDKSEHSPKGFLYFIGYK